MPEIINAVWIGPELGPVHQACLRSFLRHGHDVVLHVFDPPSDIPAGVRTFDASKLMRREEVIRHAETGSYSLASDIYRYRMLHEGLGLYVDCDIYCLRPFPSSDYVMGWESGKYIANGVLKLPQGSALLGALLEATGDPFYIPPWVSSGKRRKLSLRKKLGFPVPVSKMNWGTFGPSLLTHHAKALNVDRHAMPIDAFYSLHYEQTPLLFERGLSLSDLVTKRAYALHLANSLLPAGGAPDGSPLAEVLAL